MKVYEHAWKSPRLRRRVGLVYGIAGIALLAAYSRTELPPFHQRLRIAIHEGGTGAPLLHIAEGFSAKHDVEIVLAPYGQLYNREWASLRGDPSEQPFDVIMLDDPWLARFATPEKDGGAAPLRPLEGELRKRLESDYFAKSVSHVCQIPYCVEKRPCVGTPRYYAVPFVANTQLFARGPAVPEDTPDWEKVQQAKERLDQSGRAFGYAMRRGPGNSIVTDFIPILWSYCPECWHAGIGPLPEREGLAAIEKLVQLSRNDKGKRRPGFADESLDDFDLASYWAKDAADMGLVWSSWAMSLANIRANDGAKHQMIRYDVVPGSRPALGAWLLAIPANARYPGLAEEFLSWATDRDRMIDAARQGNPPPVAGLLSSLPLSGKFDFSEAQQQSLAKAHPRPRTPCWKDLESQIGTTLYGATAGLYDTESALAKINGIVNESPCRER
jgi:ABC-type glycerol-3-phosphate transport system substrate-binding protein